MSDLPLYQNKMKIIHTTLDKIDFEIYQKLYQLNFRGGGRMRSTLVRCRKDKVNDTHISYAMDENEMVLGWGIGYSEKRVRTDYSYQCYIRKNARRSGIGSKLFNGMIKKSKVKTFRVFAYEPSTISFYKPFIKQKTANPSYV